MRLLSKDEILNYKEELLVDVDNIIPLIYLYNNDFVIYDINKNVFATLNIVDEVIYDEKNSIDSYLCLLKDFK